MKHPSEYDLKDKDGVKDFAGDIGVDLIESTNAIVLSMSLPCRVQFWGALLSVLSGAMCADLGTKTGVAVMEKVTGLLPKATEQNDKH